MKKTKNKRGLAKPKKLVGRHSQALEALTECGCHETTCRSRGAGGSDNADDILF
jgi:hypothetical protein